MPREHLAPNPCIEPGAKGKIPCNRLFLLDRDPGDDAGRALGGGRGGGARGKGREGGQMGERGMWESRFWSNRAAGSYVINILIEVFSFGSGVLYQSQRSKV